MLVGLNAILMLLCFLLNQRSVLAVWFAILMALSWLQSVIVLLAVLGLEEAEAFGVREALSWLKNLRLPRVVIELDCLQVFKVSRF